MRLFVEQWKRVRSLQQVFVLGQFRTFASDIISRLPGVQALEWIPQVQHEHRALYEDLQSTQYELEFNFTKKEDGVFQTDDVRDYYYPVYYVEPFMPNLKAVLFNLGSSAVRLAALVKSSSTAAQVASGRITLVQE
eukprot:301736_1